MVKTSRVSCWRSHELFSEAGECLGGRDTAAPSQQPVPPSVFEEILTKFPSVEEENWEDVSAPTVPIVPVQLMLQSKEMWKWELKNIPRPRISGGCEHHDVVDWVIQIYVGWLLRYNGLQNTSYKMGFPLLMFWVSADISFHFCLCWAVSLHVCAWQMYRAEQFGYRAWKYSEMARNERNDEKSLQWNSENCFPLYFWPSWAICTSESCKALLWSLNRGEAVFLGGLFPGL